MDDVYNTMTATATTDSNQPGQELALLHGEKLGRQIDADLLHKLRRVQVLTSLPEDQFVCLESAEIFRLKNSETIVHQGEASHFFWMLLQGELNVSQILADGTEANLYVLPVGSAFGEVPLLASIPVAVNVRAIDSVELLRLNEETFWSLMTTCPEVRKAILGNMALRVQKMQSVLVHQEKMASLGTLAAGLMHELNNPGAAARRAASQLRENLLRLHQLTSRFAQHDLTRPQKECLFELQEQAMATRQPLRMNSLEQSDAEEALATWMENAQIENAWKLAPTLVSIGITAHELECAHDQFGGSTFSDALSWLEAMVSSMQLVGTIEESIGRVGDLVHAVKSYVYEGKGQRQAIDINDSIHSTLVILGHKFREKEIVVEKSFAENLPALQTECTGLNQIWTNLLDNAVDAVPQKGRIRIRTWSEDFPKADGNLKNYICISVADNGSGIPIASQSHIFGPFYTTKQVGVGTGLGLGIVHRILEGCGGKIFFTSEPGYTEFIVRLPSNVD